MGPAFAREFPEVDGFVRFSQTPMTTRNGEDCFFEESCYVADPNIFNVFTFKWIKGNPQKALQAPMTVVLTETIARKYFDNLFYDS